MASPTSAREWKKATTGHELPLPSGNVCLVKRIGMEKLLESGIIPDSLSKIVMEQIQRAQIGPQDHKKKDQGLDDAALAKMLGDPNALANMMSSFDKVTAECVISPKVLWHRRPVRGDDGLPTDEVEDIPDDERDPDVLYTDDVDQDDKMFIFNYVVGGTKDLEQFRQERLESVESI
jgi:hypothetical protein